MVEATLGSGGRVKLGGGIGIGAVISQTFATVARHWRCYYAVALFIAILGAPGFVKFFVPQSNAVTLLSGATMVVRGLVGIAMQASLTYATAQALEGAGFSLREGLAVGLRRFLPYFAAALLFYLAFMLGLVLLVVPGLVVVCTYGLAPAISVIERAGPIRSQSRSRELTRGSRWQLLAIVLIFYLLPALFFFAIGFAAARGGRVGAQGQLTLQFIIMGSNLLLSPIYFALPAVLYERLRMVHGGPVPGIADVFA